MTGKWPVTDCTNGCPIGSLALEIHEPDPSLRTLLPIASTCWPTVGNRCLPGPPRYERPLLALLGDAMPRGRRG